MKRYFVITHKSEDNEHLNVQDLLPASCKLITGIAVVATAKQTQELKDVTDKLYFPQALISDLLKSNDIANLFYSYLRTRPNRAESRAFFESDILPQISRVLSDGIKYSCLNMVEQQELSNRITDLLASQFTDYLYNEVELYTVGQDKTSFDFAEFIAMHTLAFMYLKKDDVFVRTKQNYKQPKSYECGNISLLINGNDFLLRDYVLTANRKVRHINREIIPFHEPLEVNSNIHTVFKSNKNSNNNTLTIRTYIQYQ